MITCPKEIKIQIPALVWDWDKEKAAVFIGTYREGEAIISEIRPVRNIHKNPYDHWALGARQWKRVREKAAPLDVLGLVHGHPPRHSAYPSAQDIAFAQRWNFTAMAVYHCSSGLLTWFDDQGEIAQERLESPSPSLWQKATSLLR